jgi:tetratricopeptide (TPR) repeat protein
MNSNRMPVLLLGVLTILTPACSDSARSISTQDVSTYRDDVEHHFELGFTLQNIGDLEGAIAEYRAALRLNPSHANAHYNLGVVLQDMGKPTEAAREFRESLRFIPESPANRGKIGQVKDKLSEIGLGKTR